MKLLNKVLMFGALALASMGALAQEAIGPDSNIHAVAFMHQSADHGPIILLDAQGPCTDNTYIALEGTSETTDTIKNYGCWTYDGKNIIVAWLANNKEVYATYNANDFEAVGSDAK